MFEAIAGFLAEYLIGKVIDNALTPTVPVLPGKPEKKYREFQSMPTSYHLQMSKGHNPINPITGQTVYITQEEVDLKDAIEAFVKDGGSLDMLKKGKAAGLEDHLLVENNGMLMGEIELSSDLPNLDYRLVFERGEKETIVSQGKYEGRFSFQGIKAERVRVEAYHPGGLKLLVEYLSP